MTSNKRFKRRVRDRAAKTGESYTTALARLTARGGGDGERLDTYLADIRAIPPITVEEERELLVRARAGDVAAARAAVVSQLPRAAHAALPLAARAGLTELEAVAEANVVVMRLVEGDDHTVSERLEDEVRARLSTP